MTGSPVLPAEWAWRELVTRSLAEDVGAGDVTSALVIPASQEGCAVIEAREPLRVCGLGVARVVFAAVDPSLRFHEEVHDGTDVAAGTPLATVAGSLRAIFAGERTALNFLGRMCGIASLTQRYVIRVKGMGVDIVDTRKTLPGWRVLDKYAVAVGGGINQRMGLFDGILLKDNHVAAAGGVSQAVKSARAAAPAHLRVQVEVESLEQAVAAVDAGADFLLLDNRSPAELRVIAERLRGRAILEASGGITIDNLHEVAASGVHRVSIGALTHSAPAKDVALELLPGGVGV
ncbi:MAG TPA: carboxylating nicotinate-nucleotide diphosphorylase [Myxococcota bacterium]|nr:carboxylating nicotinate-nucleotide diphosphorylase [Myxococcota bacterium]